VIRDDMRHQTFYFIHFMIFIMKYYVILCNIFMCTRYVSRESEIIKGKVSIKLKGMS